MKREESRINSLLTKVNVDFTTQHFIDFTCMGPNRDGDRCFIDFVIQITDALGRVGFVFLEVDEHQHQGQSVSCELRRMSDAHSSLLVEGNTMPFAFLRYNPNAYRINGVSQRFAKAKREERLVEVLNNWSFEREFEAVYMFYDAEEGEATVWKDPAFNSNFREICRLI